MDVINKMALLLVKDGRFLINRKYNTDLFLMPGGRLEEGETEHECVIREIEEEHCCGVIRDSLEHFGDFEDVAANEENTIVRMKVFTAEVYGEPVESSEVEEQRWFGKGDDVEILSPIIRNKILPVVLEKEMI